VCVWALAGVGGCAAPSVKRVPEDVAKAVEASLAGGTERFDHAAWGNLLGRGTREGLVDYRFMQGHHAELDAYLSAVGAARLDRLAAGQLEALLINAYNAYTVRAILDHPDVASIKKIPGVWTQTKRRVGGFDLTLDDIEHGILRPFFRDPRVHFALNCASRSCAPLPMWAYDGDRIDMQLEDRAASFVSDPKNVDFERDTLVVSKYFDWYGGDFTAEGWKGTAPTVLAYIARYAAPDVRVFIESRKGKPAITFAEYDWSLNAAVPPDPSVRP
jgi:uncharacterized protein DUF547